MLETTRYCLQDTDVVILNRFAPQMNPSEDGEENDDEGCSEGVREECYTLENWITSASFETGEDEANGIEEEES